MILQNNSCNIISSESQTLICGYSSRNSTQTTISNQNGRKSERPGPRSRYKKKMSLCNRANYLHESVRTMTIYLQEAASTQSLQNYSTNYVIGQLMTKFIKGPKNVQGRVIEELVFNYQQHFSLQENRTFKFKIEINDNFLFSILPHYRFLQVGAKFLNHIFGNLLAYEMLPLIAPSQLKP